jgi:hypothetical protein
MLVLPGRRMSSVMPIGANRQEIAASRTYLERGDKV